MSTVDDYIGKMRMSIYHLLKLRELAFSMGGMRSNVDLFYMQCGVNKFQYQSLIDLGYVEEKDYTLVITEYGRVCLAHDILIMVELGRSTTVEKDQKSFTQKAAIVNWDKLAERYFPKLLSSGDYTVNPLYDSAFTIGVPINTGKFCIVASNEKSYLICPESRLSDFNQEVLKGWTIGNSPTPKYCTCIYYDQNDYVTVEAPVRSGLPLYR